MRPALGPVCRQRRGDAVVAPEHRREGPGVGERREPPAPSWGSCRGPRRRAGRRPRRGRDRGGRPAAADVAVARRQEVVTRSSRWSCSPAKGRARSRTRRRPRSWPRRCRARGSTRTRSSGPARSGGCRGSGGCCGNAGRAPRRRAARGRRRRPTGRRRDRPGRGEQARSRGGRPTLPVGPDDEVEGAVARGVGAHHHPAVVRAHGGHRHAGCTNPGSACPLDITGWLDLDGVATPETKTEGDFDGVGWSFPAGQLPAPGVAVLAARHTRSHRRQGRHRTSSRPPRPSRSRRPGGFPSSPCSRASATAMRGTCQRPCSTPTAMCRPGSPPVTGGPGHPVRRGRPGADHRTGRDEQRPGHRRAVRAPVGRHRRDGPRPDSGLGDLRPECAAGGNVDQRAPRLSQPIPGYQGGPGRDGECSGRALAPPVSVG